MIPALLRRHFPPSDERTAAQIDRDIQDEFALHLHLIERDLIHEGLDPAAAHAAAAARFGDPAAAARRCRAIALKERLMLQRINLGLLVIIAAALAWNIYATGAAQRQQATVIRTLLDRSGAAGARTSLSDRSDAATDATPRSKLLQTIYVEGRVSRPGAYAITDPGMSLRRLLAVAGHMDQLATEILVVNDDNGQRTVRFELTREQFEDVLGPDTTLKPGDLVRVN